MLEGLLLIALIALSWTGVAAAYRRAAAAGIPLVPLGFCISLIGLIGSCLAVDWQALADGVHPRLPALALVMAGNGVLNQSGILLLARGMSLGHGSLTWMLGQSAVVMPFAFAVVYWDEPVGVGRWLGLALIVASFAGAAQSRRRAPGSGPGPRGLWAGVTALSFGALGVSQILALVPSHWGMLGALARLRVTLSLAAATLVFLVLLAVRRQRLTRQTLRFALPVCACMLTGQYALYRVADVLAAHRLSAIVFPMGIGGSVLGFILISRFMLGEPFDRTAWLTVAVGTTGIMLLA